MNEDTSRRQQKLVKLLRQCTPGNAQLKAAARMTYRYIQETKPKAWRWPKGVEVLSVLHEDFIRKRKDSLTRAKLVDSYIVDASQMRAWHVLSAGKMAVLVEHGWLVILPADSAEPMF